jgi:hypothetical protein
VFVWLQKGYQPHEIAIFFDISYQHLGMEARRQLPPPLWERYRKLVATNKARNYRHRMYRNATKKAHFLELNREGARRRARERKPSEKFPWKQKAFREQGGRKYPTVIRPECGTTAGYQKHDYRWEITCDPCKVAINQRRRKQHNDRKAREREQAQADQDSRADHGEAGAEFPPVGEGSGGQHEGG